MHQCTDDRNERCSPDHCAVIGCPWRGVPDVEAKRFEALEKDVAALRGALIRALALVQRRGTFVPDWRGALRMLEHWALRQAPMTHAPPPPK